MNELIISEDLFFDAAEGDFAAIVGRAAKKMEEMGIVKSSYFQAVLDREEEYPTGLEGMYGNFAIPHTYSEHCLRSALAILRPAKPMSFVRMDDHDSTLSCSLIILLAIDRPEMQLEMLRKLMKAMQDEALFTLLRDEPSAGAVMDALHKICS